MSGRLFVGGWFVGFDDNGDPLSGGKVYFYQAGTSTPEDTYSDAAMSVVNSNPVILDSAGRASIFLKAVAYKVALYTSADVLVRSQDNVLPLAPAEIVGTWTPVIGGTTSESGQTYSQQQGRYVKIGRLVYAQFNVTLSAKGTITGTVIIKGLPFTVDSSSIGGGTISYFASLATAVVFLSCYPQVGGTYAVIVATTAAATSVSNLAAADVSNTTQLAGMMVYYANA